MRAARGGDLLPRPLLVLARASELRAPTGRVPVDVESPQIPARLRQRRSARQRDRGEGHDASAHVLRKQ